MGVLVSRVLRRPSDLDRSPRFYRDLLGRAVYREFGDSTHRGIVFFLGGGFLEVSGTGEHNQAATCRCGYRYEMCTLNINDSRRAAHGSCGAHGSSCGV